MALKAQGGRLVSAANNTEKAAINAIDAQVASAVNSIRAAQGGLRQLFSKQGASAASANLDVVWRALERAEDAMKVAEESLYKAAKN